jgi:hypothetical protein
MAALAGAGVSWEQVAGCHSLAGGTFNAVHFAAAPGCQSHLSLLLALRPELPSYYPAAQFPVAQFAIVHLQVICHRPSLGDQHL